MQKAVFLSDAVLMYEGRTVAVRPSVAKMLQAIWNHHGEAFDAYTWFFNTYKRPGTLRAVRQTAFRCSRALERVGCPLVIHCVALQVFPKLLVRNFEKVMHTDHGRA
ncbi:MAG: hypothetical protein QM754_05340 [Tepidisphaeraceae bacterium]